jgi:hypothetical protein
MRPRAIGFASLLLALLVSTDLFAQLEISPGTILPASLETSISSRKSRPGKKVSARIMQDVPLRGRTVIPAGAKIVGQIISVDPAGSGAGARVSLRFDTLVVRHQEVRISTHLRALASSVDVQSAQISIHGTDAGTPSNAETTRQVGGELVYRGGGPVARGSHRVGVPVPDGVMVRVSGDPSLGCAGEVPGGERLEALWVFSSDACGVFGYRHVEISHAGRTEPLGTITLATRSGDFTIHDGAGLLLRVDAIEK